MKISNLAMNLRGPWMITPDMAATMAPVLKGILSGYLTEFEKSAEPRKVSCSELMEASGSQPGSFTGKSIFVTALSGTLLKYDSCGAPGTTTIARQLLEADADPDVIGHIIMAESGGGASNAVPEIAEAIQACKKPVVAWIDGIAASACIYAVSYCDRILAHREDDIVGSVGTLIEISDMPMYHRDPNSGMITARIYADAAVDKNAAFEKALEGQFNIIKEERLNPINEKFRADMQANRPNLTEEHLTGKVFPAKAAIGTFIDAIGTMGDAAAAVMELAEQKNPQQTNSQNSMKEKFPLLLAIAALAELQFAQDGSATLQAPQFEALEEALKNGNGLQGTIDELRQQLADAQAAQTERDNTIAARDARITELEASLEAAIARAENPNPEEVQVHHEGEGEQGAKPSTTFEEALAACKDFNEKHNI